MQRSSATNQDPAAFPQCDGDRDGCVTKPVQTHQAAIMATLTDIPCPDRMAARKVLVVPLRVHPTNPGSF